MLLVSGVALFFKADGAMVELAISGSAGMTGPSETTASGVTESISNTSGVAAELSTSVTIQPQSLMSRLILMSRF